MSERYCVFCLVIISYLKFLNSAIIPLIPLISSTSTYKPSTLLLPPGFDSQKVPLQPMLYPYAVSSSDISTRRKLKNTLGTTPGWIPVALNVKSELPLIPTLHSTTPSHPAAVLEHRISNEEPKYSSPSYKEGPVFESIVYGTWKPDPPLEPVKILSATKQQHENTSNTSGSKINRGLIFGDERVYNKTINRQHGGFIGNIQQKPSKADRKLLSSTLTPDEYRSKEFIEISTEPRLQRKIKKQGRRRIRSTTSTTEQNSIERSSIKEEITTTKENIQHQKNVIKVNPTNPKFTEVAKQINESIKSKYNHKQTSTHSIDVMTTANENDDDEYDDNNNELSLSNTLWTTKSKEFFSTVPQIDYDNDDYDNVEIFPHVSATRRSWPTDFMEEPLTTTYANYQSLNNSDKFKFNDSPETDPLEMPFSLSALNIPPSLWPKLPGNITKLGKPYEAESSAEEAALCVPITVREQNIMNSKELIYIERVFCFPMPLPTTTSENDVINLENIFTSSTTLKTFTTVKIHNIKDFIDSNSRVSNASSIFKKPFYLVTSILVIYFKFTV